MRTWLWADLAFICFFFNFYESFELVSNCDLYWKLESHLLITEKTKLYLRCGIYSLHYLFILNKKRMKWCWACVAKRIVWLYINDSLQHQHVLKACCRQLYLLFSCIALHSTLNWYDKKDDKNVIFCSTWKYYYVILWHQAIIKKACTLWLINRNK